MQSMNYNLSKKKKKLSDGIPQIAKINIIIYGEEILYINEMTWIKNELKERGIMIIKERLHQNVWLKGFGE